MQEKSALLVSDSPIQLIQHYYALTAINLYTQYIEKIMSTTPQILPFQVRENLLLAYQKMHDFSSTALHFSMQ